MIGNLFQNIQSVLKKASDNETCEYRTIIPDDREEYKLRMKLGDKGYEEYKLKVDKDY